MFKPNFGCICAHVFSFLSLTLTWIMDQDECKDIFVCVKNTEPWDCKMMIDGTDIAPCLTSYDNHENF